MVPPSDRSSDHSTAPMTTGALSLLELRRHLVRRSGTLAARAQRLQGQGDVASAALLIAESRRLRSAARAMDVAKPPGVDLS